MNIISRRSFLERASLAGAGMGLAALTDIPFVMKRALAAGIGSGKKLMFIWLRFGQDGLNALIPTGDSNYATVRPTIGIPSVWTGGAAPTGYTGGMPFVTSGGGNPGTGTFATPYDNAYPTGNGFASIHPALKFLAPVYNHGDLTLIHRVGYPRLSRSHFDSQNYWENALPGNNLTKEGFLYRTAYESGLANTQALTAVSIQGALPLILQGDKAAMTNLADPLRYDLLGIPNSVPGNTKANSAISNALAYPFASKNYRDMFNLQYKNLTDTLTTFSNLNFTNAGNNFYDGPIGNATHDTAHGGASFASDGDDTWRDAWNTLAGQTAASRNNYFADSGYWLFPHDNVTNGGWQRTPGGTNVAGKYVVSPNNTYYSFLKQVKAAALILNNTDAFIAGTELSGFDHHNDEIGATPLDQGGVFYNHMRAVGWAYYALFKFFKIYGKNGTHPQVGAKCDWNDLVIVSFSEFGRTSVQNATRGTDHAEAGLMWVAGGAVNGFVAPGNIHSVPNNTNGGSGIYCCSTTQSPNANAINVNWALGPAFNTSTASNPQQTGTGTLFNASGRYLHRAVDYRSIFGEIIRDHLGGSQTQLDRIIPAYASEGSYKLKNGGVVNTPIDSVATTTSGEINVV